MHAYSFAGLEVTDVSVFSSRQLTYRLHERVFAHKLSGILHQHSKSVEQPAAQADFLVITKQSSLIHIEEVIVKEVLDVCEKQKSVSSRRCEKHT